MKMITTKIITVTALLAFSFSAVAQKNPARYFKKLDTDGSETLTLDEFKGHSDYWMDKRGWTDEDRRARTHKNTFKKRDADGDGVISKKEFIKSSNK